MPDFMLVFAITVLAHHPDFESTQDVDFLKRYFFKFRKRIFVHLFGVPVGFYIPIFCSDWQFNCSKVEESSNQKIIALPQFGQNLKF